MYNFIQKMERKMSKSADIDKLAQIMGLSQYQTDVLKNNTDKYDFSGLVKRGGVLYAPHQLRTKSIFEIARRALTGKSADLIGPEKMLLQGRRKIKFYAGGFHCVSIGQFKYYADKDGHAVPRDVFMQYVSDNRR